MLALTAADPGVAALRASDARVAAIAWRLQTANAPICPETVLLPGFTVQTLAQYRPSVRTSFLPGSKLERRPIIYTVIPGGPADRAGIGAGDVLLAIGNAPTPRELLPRASYEATARTQAMIDAASASPPMTLRMMRGNRSRTVRLTGQIGCASRVEIVTDDTTNAQADGQIVLISGALVEFAENDDELATIIGHELAHNILHHNVGLDSEKTPRGLFARFGRRGAAARKAEFEADRLAVWLIARAGYDVDSIVPFWMRLGQRSDTEGPSDGTHPDWNARIDNAAAAVAELKAQRSAGAPLLPTKLVTNGPTQQSSSHAQFPR